MGCLFTPKRKRKINENCSFIFFKFNQNFYFTKLKEYESGDSVAPISGDSKNLKQKV